MQRLLVWGIIFVASGWIALFLSGKGILIDQEKVDPGEQRIVEGWGDVGEADQASLVCTYFVATRTRQQVFWYSPNGMFGRADCPTLIDR